MPTLYDKLHFVVVVVSVYLSGFKYLKSKFLKESLSPGQQIASCAGRATAEIAQLSGHAAGRAGQTTHAAGQPGCEAAGEAAKKTAFRRRRGRRGWFSRRYIVVQA